MTSVEETIDWLLAAGTRGEEPLALVDGLLRRLNDARVPVWRLSMSMSTVDPLLRGLSLIAWRDRPPSLDSATHGAAGEAAFQASPIYFAQSRGLSRYRWRLLRAEDADGLPMLLRLHGEGATDYLMQLVTFGGERAVANGAAFAFATDRPGGFEDRHIAVFDALLPALGLVAKCFSLTRTTTEALSVYLGPRTSQRVLGGEIRRGFGQTISAAVLIADLRGFTALAARADPATVVRLLDDHFELIGAAVEAHDGEVLKFLGDGLLAIFPFTEDPASGPRACDRALAAAEQALAGTGALNAGRTARGEPALVLDIALNAGEVVYGNVGAARRLDFTVIGSAVNEAARMEHLCEALDRNLVLSESFARLCSRPTVEIDRVALRGLAGERSIWAPAG
jgi:adenylate cyclase